MTLPPQKRAFLYVANIALLLRCAVVVERKARALLGSRWAQCAGHGARFQAAS